MASRGMGFSRGRGHHRCKPPGPKSRSWGGASLAEAMESAGTRLVLLPGLRAPICLLLWAPSKVHPLLIHPLGLHPLNEAEEILVGHGGASGQHVRRRAALVIDPGGLGRQTRGLVVSEGPVVSGLGDNTWAGAADLGGASSGGLVRPPRHLPVRLAPQVMP